MLTRTAIALSVIVGLGQPGLAVAARPAPAAVKAKPAAAHKPKAPGKPPAAGKAAPSTAAPAPGSHTWALLIGISKYQNPAIVSLRFPASDATAIRDALVDPQLGGLPAGNARLLTNEQATTANILGAVDSFLKPNVKPGDQVVIFLAGHGVAKGVGLEGKSYFLSTDVHGLTTPMLDASAVSLKTLSEKLSELPAAKFIVFMDACREDPTPGRGVKGNTMTDIMSRGLQIAPQDPSHPVETATFFACSIGQRAFEDPELQHGVFTYSILEGIRAGDVPRRPDGAVDMGLLASFVKNRVSAWAKSTSDKGDFEVEQTPDFVTNELSEPIVLMRVRRPLPTAPLAAVPPTLMVMSQPPGAQVSIDGERVGTAPVTKSLPHGGQYTLRLETPGCAPVERPITVLDGYGLQMSVTLPPAPADAIAAPGSAAASDLYARAQAAEARQEWEVAEAGYDAAVKADPKFALAYERLADLRLRRNETPAAIGTLVDEVNQAPSPHAYSLLSRAYSLFAIREAGREPQKGAPDAPKRKKGGLLGSVLGRRGKSPEARPAGPVPYAIPADAAAAAALALQAAHEAASQGPPAADSQSALGFALMVTDKGGANREAALAAFGQAVLLEPQNAASYYGLGCGIRTFAQRIPDDATRKSELQRAVESLKQALALRPDYYEAHRELAFCYHLLDDLPAAQHEYEQANANRGAAVDENEVAAVNLSLAGIDRQQAQTANGDQKQNLLAASDGYLSDAREISPNLEIALRILSQAGVSTRLADYLPPELHRLLDLPGELERNIKSHIPAIPGLP